MALAVLLHHHHHHHHLHPQHHQIDMYERWRASGRSVGRLHLLRALQIIFYYNQLRDEKEFLFLLFTLMFTVVGLVLPHSFYGQHHIVFG